MGYGSTTIIQFFVSAEIDFRRQNLTSTSKVDPRTVRVNTKVTPDISQKKFKPKLLFQRVNISGFALALVPPPPPIKKHARCSPQISRDHSLAFLFRLFGAATYR